MVLLSLYEDWSSISPDGDGSAPSFSPPTHPSRPPDSPPQRPAQSSSGVPPPRGVRSALSQDPSSLQSLIDPSSADDFLEEPPALVPNGVPNQVPRSVLSAATTVSSLIKGATASSASTDSHFSSFLNVATTTHQQQQQHQHHHHHQQSAQKQALVSAEADKVNGLSPTGKGFQTQMSSASFESDLPPSPRDSLTIPQSSLPLSSSSPSSVSSNLSAALLSRSPNLSHVSTSSTSGGASDSNGAGTNASQDKNAPPTPRASSSIPMTLTTTQSGLGGTLASSLESGHESSPSPPETHARILGPPPGTILKRHVCSFEGCFKSFHRKSDLIRHERIHVNDRPHVCTWPDCGKRFGQKHALKVHYRTHTGERPHLCPWEGCLSSFSDSSSLARHKKKVHRNDRMLKCQVIDCGREFFNKHDLNEHMSVHGDELERQQARQTLSDQQMAWSNFLRQSFPLGGPTPVAIVDASTGNLVSPMVYPVIATSYAAPPPPQASVGYMSQGPAHSQSQGYGPSPFMTQSMTGQGLLSAVPNTGGYVSSSQSSAAPPVSSSSLQSTQSALGFLSHSSAPSGPNVMHYGHPVHSSSLQQQQQQHPLSAPIMTTTSVMTAGPASHHHHHPVYHSSQQHQQHHQPGQLQQQQQQQQPQQPQQPWNTSFFPQTGRHSQSQQQPQPYHHVLSSSSSSSQPQSQSQQQQQHQPPF